MSGLPALIDPVLLAERGARLAGRLALKGMPRLCESCVGEAGEVEVDLEFRRPGELREMAGEVRAVIRVRCQRCLEPMELTLQTSPHLILLRPGEREDLVEAEADTLVVDKPVALGTLIEDELILALPMIPMHAPGACPSGAEGETTPQKRNPFAVLQNLKKTDR
jgi:uncharacterized protein